MVIFILTLYMLYCKLNNIFFILFVTFSLFFLTCFHTVPRKVLKEKYQGEPEPDEILGDETENNNEDGNELTDRIIEQPSIYSPSHTTSWDSRSSKSRNINQISNQPNGSGRTSQKPILISTHQSSGWWIFYMLG